MVIRHQSPDRGAVKIAKGASLAVTDKGYLRIQKEWRKLRRRLDGMPADRS